MPTFFAGADTTTPVRPINTVVKSGLIEVIGTSTQQMNSVVVDNWFSLPMLLGLPPKKSRSTKTGLLGRLDFTSSVNKVKSPVATVGLPVTAPVYLISPATCPVTAW